MIRRVMIITGEASGDLHGSGVVRAIKLRQPECEVYGIGGDKMHEAGTELIYHIRQTSFLGFWEVVEHLPFIRRVLRHLEQVLHSRRPDVVVLIDYPGFNLKFAEIVKQQGIKVIYYISPQVWAWGRGRLKKMRGLIDKMLVMFPFEVEIYQKAGIDVKLVGHPLLDVLRWQVPDARSQFCQRRGFDEKKRIVGLFPGSRTMEVKRLFPTMLEAGLELKNRLGVEVGVGVAPDIDVQLYERLLDENGVRLVQNDTYDLMRYADLAIVKAGTSTLETTCFGTPMIIVYKISLLTYLIGRSLVNVKNLGMVNILAGRQIVPELIQMKATVKNLVREATELLSDEKLRHEMKGELLKVRAMLGTAGASDRVAEVVLSG